MKKYKIKENVKSIMCIVIPVIVLIGIAVMTAESRSDKQEQIKIEQCKECEKLRKDKANLEQENKQSKAENKSWKDENDRLNRQIDTLLTEKENEEKSQAIEDLSSKSPIKTDSASGISVGDTVCVTNPMNVYDKFDNFLEYYNIPDNNWVEGRKPTMGGTYKVVFIAPHPSKDIPAVKDEIVFVITNGCNLFLMNPDGLSKE